MQTTASPLATTALCQAAGATRGMLRLYEHDALRVDSEYGFLLRFLSAGADPTGAITRTAPAANRATAPPIRTA